MNILVYVSQINAIFLKDKNQISLKTLYRLLKKHCNYFKFVTGYCTEYNEVGTVIQEHYNRKCADVSPPCASTYLSTESYHCKNLRFQIFNLSLYAENRCLIYSTACTFRHAYMCIPPQASNVYLQQNK